MPAVPPFRIAAIGELLWDLLPSGPRLGGAPTNFAVMSSRLGADAALVSRTGEDPFGRAALEQLGSIATSPQRLDLSCLQNSASLPTGTVSVTLGTDGQPSYRIADPVAWDEIEFTPQLANLARRMDVVCFGSLAQRNQASRRTIREFVEAVPPECVRVCDINLRAPFYIAENVHWSLANSTLLKVSSEELPEVARMLQIESGLLLEEDTSRTQQYTSFARELLRRAPNCRLIAITLGPHGSLLVDATSSHREPARQIAVSDTIGAGDAFTAGMVYAYLREGSLAQISAVGNLCGSFVASQPGATPELPEPLLSAIDAVFT